MSAPESFQSRVVGGVQPASVAVSCRFTEWPPAFRFSGSCGPPRAYASGVGQPARLAAFSSPICTFVPSALLPVNNCSSLITRPPFGQFGVGHPVQSVSDVRRTDARRRKRDRPEGVTQGFQVSLYKVEPRVCVFACNLFTNAFDRSTLADEVEGVGP